MKQHTGLRTDLYTFKTHAAMVESINKNKSKGRVTIVYLDNAYRYELVEYITITF